MFYGTSVNSAELDKTMKNVVSDQVLDCLLAECSLNSFPATLKFKMSSSN